MKKSNFLWGILLIALVAFIISYTFLWIGLHNFDVCNNERVISLTFDIQIMEQLVGDNGYWSLVKCISVAQGLIIKSIFITMICSFILGFIMNEIRMYKGMIK